MNKQPDTPLPTATIAPTYNVDYFIRKFEAIPDNYWCVNLLRDAKGRHCARGHCGTKTNLFRTPEDIALCALFYDLLPTTDSAGAINNGELEAYQQPTPRARILAALRDIKAKNDVENRKESCVS